MYRDPRTPEPTDRVRGPRDDRWRIVTAVWKSYVYWRWADETTEYAMHIRNWRRRVGPNWEFIPDASGAWPVPKR